MLNVYCFCVISVLLLAKLVPRQCNSALCSLFNILLKEVKLKRIDIIFHLMHFNLVFDFRVNRFYLCFVYLIDLYVLNIDFGFVISALKQHPVMLLLANLIPKQGNFVRFTSSHDLSPRLKQCPLKKHF